MKSSNQRQQSLLDRQYTPRRCKLMENKKLYMCKYWSVMILNKQFFYRTNSFITSHEFYCTRCACCEKIADWQQSDQSSRSLHHTLHCQKGGSALYVEYCHLLLQWPICPIFMTTLHTLRNPVNPIFQHLIQLTTGTGCTHAKRHICEMTHLEMPYNSKLVTSDMNQI